MPKPWTLNQRLHVNPKPSTLRVALNTIPGN